MKRAGLGHELGEVEEGLRLAAAGMRCPAEHGMVAAYRAGHRCRRVRVYGPVRENCVRVDVCGRSETVDLWIINLEWEFRGTQ